MKNIKYIVIILLGVIFLNSCKKVENDVNKIQDGKNLAAFEDGSQAATRIADGTEYGIPVKVKLTGPSLTSLKNDVTVTFSYDADLSTAVEGTHFSLANNTMTLSADNDYLGLFEFTMLTAGIATPLVPSPVLALTVSSASGDASVIASGKPIMVTLNYACPSELQGMYDVDVLYTGYDGTVTALAWSEEIFKAGVGEYRTTRVGHWSVADLGGTPGFTFYDVCSTVTVPGQNLVDTYSNWVEGISGSVDEATGVISIEYSICTDTGCRYYECTYTPQ